MGEVDIIGDLYFKNEENRKNFLQQIEQSQKYVEINAYHSIAFDRIYVDDVISFTGFPSVTLFSEAKSEFSQWINTFKPDVAIVNYSGEYESEEVEIYLLNGIPSTYKTTLAKLYSISPRIGNGLARRKKSDKVLVKYLKTHKTDPLECYQGQCHIDYCVETHKFKAIEYFVDTGLVDPLHRCAYSTNLGGNRPYLIEKILCKEGFGIFKKLIKNGADINLLDSCNSNFLHKICKEDMDIPMSKYLLDKGIDINHQNDFGRTPLNELVYWALWYGKIDKNEQKKLFKWCSFLLDYGAKADVLDKDGGDILGYAYKNIEVWKWFKKNCPEIEATQTSMNDRKIITATDHSEIDTFNYYKMCLENGILEPFNEPEFRQCLHVTIDDEFKKKEKVHDTAKDFAYLACKFDQPQILKVLESMGFPALIQCVTNKYKNFNTFTFAKKRNAKQVLNYLESKDITANSIEHIWSPLKQWATNSFPEDLSFIKSHVSQGWLTGIEQKWEEQIEEDAKDLSLKEYTKQRFKNILFRATQEDIFSSTFGIDKIILKEDVLISVNETYQVSTREELYGLLGLEKN